MLKKLPNTYLNKKPATRKRVRLLQVHPTLNHPNQHHTMKKLILAILILTTTGCSSMQSLEIELQKKALLKNYSRDYVDRIIYDRFYSCEATMRN